MATSHRILLTTSLALASAGFAAAMALVVLPAALADLRQAPGAVVQLADGPTTAPIPLDINAGPPPRVT